MLCWPMGPSGPWFGRSCRHLYLPIVTDDQGRAEEDNNDDPIEPIEQAHSKQLVPPVKLELRRSIRER